MKRNRMQLLKNALLAIDKNPKKTSIYYDLRLDGDLYQEIFKALLRTSMIEPCEAGYQVTDKGRRFIETTNKLEEMIK